MGQAGSTKADGGRVSDNAKRNGRSRFQRAPKLTPEQQALKMKTMYDPRNSIDASAWLGKVRPPKS
jgi:hypothetical protein